MTPEEFTTQCVQVPHYCGGTYCDVIAMHEEVKIDQYGMTAEGVKLLLPNGWLKTNLCMAVDRALGLQFGPQIKGKVTILSGPSGSGKSRYAMELVAKGDTVRINRDSLRAMALDGWNRKKEKFIIAAEKALLKVAHDLGLNVVIDDTNLTDYHLEMWRDEAHKNHFRTIMFKKMTTSLEQCIEFDAKRSGTDHVGRPVIERQFLLSKRVEWGVKPVVIVDLDGTMFNIDHRIHFVTGICPKCKGIPEIEGEDICFECAGTGKCKKDWLRFEVSCVFDTPVHAIVTWIRALAEDHTIVIVSGRNLKVSGALTIMKLDTHNIPYNHIYMRQGEDNRDDVTVKQEILDQMLASDLPKEQIAFVIDDRIGVVEMWRRNGIQTFSVRCSDRDFQ